MLSRSILVIEVALFKLSQNHSFLCWEVCSVQAYRKQRRFTSAMTGTVKCISFGSELRGRIRRDLHPVGPLRSARHARYGMVYCSECGSQVHNRNDSDLTSSYLPKSTHHDLSSSIILLSHERVRHVNRRESIGIMRNQCWVFNQKLISKILVCSRWVYPKLKIVFIFAETLYFLLELMQET